MLTDHSPATRWVDAWRVSGELFYALDFTFLQGKASLPRRVVLAEWLLRWSPVGKMEKPQNFVLRLSLFAPPTGLEPVTLRLTVECSAN